MFSCLVRRSQFFRTPGTRHCLRRLGERRGATRSDAERRILRLHGGDPGAARTGPWSFRDRAEEVTILKKWDREMTRKDVCN